MAGKNQSSAGPQSWAFMPTGPAKIAALVAATTTITLSQFVTSAIYAPQVQFWNLGTAVNANTAAFVAFGGSGSTFTVSNTVGVPIVPLALMGQMGNISDAGMQVLSTGIRPNNVVVIGTAGSTTVWITPGEGSR